MKIEHNPDGTVSITETVAEINKRYTDAGLPAPLVVIERIPILEFDIRAAILAAENTNHNQIAWITRMTKEQFNQQFSPP